MLILNGQDVANSLSHAECIELLSKTMQTVSQREVIMPLRQYMEIPGTGGKFTSMPGYLSSPDCFGIKLVSKYPAETAGSSHIGTFVLFDSKSGNPVAIMDAGELTAIRTAAASGLATQTLARENAKVLTLMGCGTEAWHHIKAVSAVRNLTKIIVWARNAEKAQAFIERCKNDNIVPEEATIEFEADAETAVRQADIVCTVTSAKTPILKGDWLQPGTHVNLVGAAVHTSSEADTKVVVKSKFYVDYMDSAMAQAGELIKALDLNLISKSHIVGEIGELLLGKCEGRTDNHSITTYKSLGVSAQDLAAGMRVFENALSRNLGTKVDW